ncbi:hypothetical protein ACLOJK_012011 [Asimina triloba]
MADYHYVYKDVEGASTQWDDIQRKLGNLPPKPAPSKPPPFTPAEEESSKPKEKAWIDEKTEEELEDLVDDPDLDDDRFLEEYRKKRLAEMRAAVRVSRFGYVIPITGADFVREVSQAPPDVWVVVLLYKEGIFRVALTLCQSDPVLNDGHSESSVLEGVRKKFIEKVVTEHEEDDDYSSD